MNIKFKLQQWRKMYDFLYTQVIGNSDYRNFAQAHSNCQIGKDCTLWPQNVYMEEHSRLQNLNNMIAWKGKLQIKKYASVSSQCIIIPGSHIPTVGLPQFLSITHINDEDRTIVVNEDAWVGAGCILLSHANIGRGAVIGSGSIVTKEIPPYAVAVGSPTKIIACRFTKEQIMEHERILYPPEERMKEDEIDKLFETYFKDKKAIGTSYMSEEDKKKLAEAKKEWGIKDYSDQ